MSGGITSIPTRIDGSAGRIKSDADPIEDLNTELPAAEFNVIADAVCGLSNEVGLTNGTTPGSLVKRVTEIEAVLIPAPIKMAGSLQQVVTTIGSEEIIGSFGAFDPTTYSTPSIVLEATFVYVPATAGSIEVRLYDMGTRLAPTGGTLRSTISTTFADVGVLKCLSRSLYVNASPGVNTDQIYNVERIYELRAILIGASPGDTLQLGAVSLVITPVIMGGPAAVPTAGYITVTPEAGLPNERTLVVQNSVLATDNGPGSSIVVELLNDTLAPGVNKVYGTDGAGVKGWRADLNSALRAYTICVGNALEGDIASDYDYLDPGDGSGIEAAATFMYGKRGSIAVRRGIYTRPSGAAIISIPGNVALIGEGRGQTYIVSPVLDAGGVPWRTLQLSGARASICDLTVSIPERGASGVAPATAIGIVTVASPLCQVARVDFEIGGAITAWTTPLAMLEFPASSTYGHEIDDVKLDMINATVTGNGANANAFFFVSSGYNAATPTPVDPYVSYYPETVFRRCSVVGGKSLSTGTPYYTRAFGMQAMSQFTVEGGYYDGVMEFINGQFQSSTVGLQVVGPRVRGVHVHGSTGMGAGGTYSTMGRFTLSLTGGGTMTMRRFEYKNCVGHGPLTNGHNLNLIMFNQGATVYGLDLSHNSFDTPSATAQSASISLTCTVGGGMEAPVVAYNSQTKSGGGGNNNSISLGASGGANVNRARVVGNVTAYLTIGNDCNNTILSDNHYSASFTDSSTGKTTSYSNNLNV